MVAALLVAGATTANAGNTSPKPTASPKTDSSQATVGIDQYMQWGEYALSNNRFSEAAARFNDVLRLDWNHPRAYRLLQETRVRRARALTEWEHAAQAAQSGGDARLAMEYFEKILAEDSTQSGIKGALARLHKRAQADRLIQSGLAKFIIEDYAAASLDFEQALAIAPSDTLAALYRERAEQKMAGASSMADLRADTAMWARYSDALKRLRAGDLAGAERLWNDVLAKYPGNEAVRSNLEQIARRRKQELTSEEFSP
jgi:tetratricopeptide (TPR) repeat protein